MLKQRLLLGSLWLCALLIILMGLYYNHSFYHDDAYITLRYAQHWLDGQGIVWNPGEYVQGYTNFLHLLLIVAQGWLGVDLLLASRIIGFLSWFGLLGLMLALPKFIAAQKNTLFSHWPALLILASVPLLVWALGGLETDLFAFCLTFSSLLFLRAMTRDHAPLMYAASGFVGALSFLARPDGAVLLIVATLWLLVLAVRQQRWQALLAFLLGGAVLILPYWIWQLSYYGDIIPNTFYAKAGAPLDLRLNNGLSYVLEYFLTPPFLPLFALLSAAWGLYRRCWRVELSFLSLVIVANFAFVAWAGGDHMPAYRFLLPIYPLLGVFLWLSLQTAWTPAPKLAQQGWLSLGFLLALSLQLEDGTAKLLNPEREDPAAYAGRMVSHYIKANWPPGSLIALNSAGAGPYYAYPYRYIDMLGLNDPVIAKRKITEQDIQLRWQSTPGHLKGDGAYILSRQPDYIIIGPGAGTIASNPWFLSDLELARDPRFAQHYRMQRRFLEADTGREVDYQTQLPFTFYERID